MDPASLPRRPHLDDSRRQAALLQTGSNTALRAWTRVALLVLASILWGCASTTPDRTPLDASDPEWEIRGDRWFEEIRQARVALEEGRLEDAEQAARRAATLSLDFDEDHPLQLTNLETIQLIAQAYHLRGESDAALRLARRIARESAKRAPPMRYLEYEMSSIEGQLALEDDRGLDAARLFTRLRRRAEHDFGEGHAVAIDATISLARAEMARGNSDRALSLSTSAIRNAEEHLGSDHSQTASVLFDHGRIQWAAGRHEDSNESFEQALATHRRHQGGGHTADDNVVLDRLAKQYFSLYDYQRARERSEEAIAVYRTYYRRTNPEIVGHLQILTVIHLRRGEYELARDRGAEAVDVAEEIYGTATDPVARALVQLADVEIADLHPDAARPLLERARGIETTLLGRSPPESGIFVRLAHCEASLGEREKAESMFEEARSRAIETFGEDSLPVAEHAVWEAMSYEQWGDAPTAQSLVGPAVERILASRRSPDALLVDGLAVRARTAGAMGAPETAEHFSQALKIGEVVFGPDSPRFAALRTSWAAFYSDGDATEGDLESPAQVVVAEPANLRFVMPGPPWLSVGANHPETSVLVALVRRNPKITFTLAAWEVGVLAAQLDGIPSESIETRHAAELFESQLAGLGTQVEVLSKSDRNIAGIPGIEFVYLVDRGKADFYYVVWVTVYDGILYELKSWSNSKRISRARLIHQSHAVQEKFDLLVR